MPRNSFDKLTTFFHLNDNSNLLRRDDPAYDKLFKIRPFVDALKKNFLKLEPEERNSVDEIMIPFKGRSGFTQYIRNKPHKWGIKMFAIADTSGMLYDFIIYTGKNTGIPACGLGISGDVVIKLTEHLPRNENFKVFCDNWFSSYKLFVALKQNGLLVTGTVRSNRLQGCQMKSDVDLKKQGRGSFDQKTDFTRTVTAVKWYDNKSVNMIFSYRGTQPMHQVKRWSIAAKKNIEVSCTALVKEYNESMGDVDFHDMLVGLYMTDIRARRYYLRIVFNSLDSSVVNAWLFYR
ncbi:hypothetical protein PR048_016093 [Dryococelus australis]|uniref:PiggyBac transposable element-derived protein domain-containing protein n=1 Tax=Dryococelus australis TaxID=614101 RepID=A0ABQ9HIS0_9NEOP|nr:hypothetical protein PR048_016093 [Dryococelus australis]